MEAEYGEMQRDSVFENFAIELPMNFLLRSF